MNIKTEPLASSITSILGETKVHKKEREAFVPTTLVHSPHPQTNPPITGSLPSTHGSPQEFPLRRKFLGIFLEHPGHPSTHRKSPE